MKYYNLRAEVFFICLCNEAWRIQRISLAVYKDTQLLHIVTEVTCFSQWTWHVANIEIIGDIYRQNCPHLDLANLLPAVEAYKD